MRLKRLNISGFKSFVDPTSFVVPGNVVGIVGPNGCGKSNVIDAVRWVLGETSARTLRGDSMADVIFNGSASRKPVGKASVELVFDNSDQSAPGSYAGFGEIAVRRTLTRDGQSDYYINKTRCRRRDITDIFKGTGLGHRSYSIIEQGMVSRIIEARPEDLRSFVEEAAGISRYKDRRRETETRIRHTRENLERVEDIRRELETQLRRLQRQSQAAKRYKVLQEEERTILGELLALRHRTLKSNADQRVREINALELGVQSALADQRNAERRIEQSRSEQLAAQEAVGEVQASYYGVGADIASVEQSIEHAQETEQQQKEELTRLKNTLSENEEALVSDRERLASLETSLGKLNSDRETQAESLKGVEAALAEKEEALRRWESVWSEFAESSARPTRQQDVEQSRIEQLESQDSRVQERLARLDNAYEEALTEQEQVDLDAVRNAVSESDRRVAEGEAQLEETAGEIREIRHRIDELRRELDAQREENHRVGSRLQSLSDLQAAALGESDEALHQWLDAKGLGSAPRLAGAIDVASGWERAVDAVLGHRLAGVCVDNLDRFSHSGGGGEAGPFLVEPGAPSRTGHGGDTLIGKINDCDYDLGPLLGRALIAASVEDAVTRRASLSPDQYFVTREGTLVGRNWLEPYREANAVTGLLEREDEIAHLGEEVGQLKTKTEALVARYDENTEALHKCEEERDRLQRELDDHRRLQTDLHRKLASEEVRFNKTEQRRLQIKGEVNEIQEELLKIEGELGVARRNYQLASDESGLHEKRRGELLKERDELNTVLVELRATTQERRDSLHTTELALQRSKASIESLNDGMQRLESQQRRLSERQESLQRLLAEGDEPVRLLKQQLDQLLNQRRSVEKSLSEARDRLAQFDNRLRDEQELLSGCEKGTETARAALEQAKIATQDVQVRLQTVEEQIQEHGQDLDELTQNLTDDASEAEWKEKAERISEKIKRLGPVNLVAIEEFEEQSERKGYLDNQHNDLMEALQTLETVMRKIDRETRARFKETFDTLNQGFAEFFPQLFGGGSAVLELTEDDLLTTGVTVMARPPGKRNSTIHLLSGGEKALTAVSLLFALFRLNPAPFCLLDEVDAPLDDANVERYCRTLRSLSERTQLIVITHNKITMETADVLLGVTMGEPGVSALVSVDVERAVQLAAV